MATQTVVKLSKASVWHVARHFVNQFEESTESFVIKVWVDDTAESTQWNGRITHVSSGEGANFENLRKIKPFIKAYLKKHAIPHTLWRVLRSTSPPAAHSHTQPADNNPA